MDLLDDARSMGEDLVRLRTELHQDPEVGLDLPRTQATPVVPLPMKGSQTTQFGSV